MDPATTSPGRERKLPAVAGTTPAVRDVIVTLTTATWMDAQNRGFAWTLDRFVLNVTSDPFVRRAIIVNPFRSFVVAAARALQRGRLHRLTSPQEVGGSPLLQPYRLRRRESTSMSAIARAYRSYDAFLERAAEQHGLVRPAVVMGNPLAAAFAPLEWAGPVTYYAEDDWSAHHAYRRMWPAFRDADAVIGRSGRGVCAVSQAIIDRISPVGPHLVVPNGVEPAEWLDVSPAPDWLLARPSPRLVYVGALDARLDVPLLTRLADAMPDASINLIGHLVDREAIAPLEGLPNVFIGPAIPRSQVPPVMAAADVGLLPHAITRLTTAMSPLKVYEYLAAGRPVVAVDLEPIRGIHPSVLIANSPEEFVAAVGTALERGPLGESERREFIRENSWEKRYSAAGRVTFREAR